MRSGSFSIAASRSRGSDTACVLKTASLPNTFLKVLHYEHWKACLLLPNIDIYYIWTIQYIPYFWSVQSPLEIVLWMSHLVPRSRGIHCCGHPGRTRRSVGACPKPQVRRVMQRSRSWISRLPDFFPCHSPEKKNNASVRRCWKLIFFWWWISHSWL